MCEKWSYCSPKGERWGQFFFTTHIMEKSGRVIEHILKKTITSVETIIYEGKIDAFRIIAISPFFDEVEIGNSVPYYGYEMRETGYALMEFGDQGPSILEDK